MNITSPYENLFEFMNCRYEKRNELEKIKLKNIQNENIILLNKMSKIFRNPSSSFLRKITIKIIHNIYPH